MSPLQLQHLGVARGVNMVAKTIKYVRKNADLEKDQKECLEKWTFRNIWNGEEDTPGSHCGYCNIQRERCEDCIMTLEPIAVEGEEIVECTDFTDLVMAAILNNDKDEVRRLVKIAQRYIRTHTNMGED